MGAGNLTPGSLEESHLSHLSTSCSRFTVLHLKVGVHTSVPLVHSEIGSSASLRD